MTLLFVDDKNITMIASMDLLEKAWHQLEVENPESISRLRQLKAEQEKAEEQKGKTEFQQSGHIEQVFKELTNS